MLKGRARLPPQRPAKKFLDSPNSSELRDDVLSVEGPVVVIQLFKGCSFQQALYISQSTITYSFSPSLVSTRKARTCRGPLLLPPYPFPLLFPLQLLLQSLQFPLQRLLQPLPPDYKLLLPQLLLRCALYICYVLEALVVILSGALLSFYSVLILAAARRLIAGITSTSSTISLKLTHSESLNLP